MDLSHLTIPDSYAGRWKILVEWFANGENSEQLHSCFELRGDIIIM
jgi:hypothetical protein